MATVGQVVENPVTGERLTFVEITDQRLILDAVWPPGDRALEHIHPAMSERFEVLAGRAAVRVDGREQTLAPGDALTVPPGTRHLARNPAEGEARLRLTFEPAGRWAQFVERLCAGDDPAALLQEFSADIRLP